MSYHKKIPTYLMLVLVTLPFGCSSTDSDNDEEDNEEVNVAFSVDCDLLICEVDVSNTISGSDRLSSVLCSMGDGNQVDPINQLEIVYEYTYSAPGSYDITCTALNEGGDQDSNTVSIRIDGISVDAGSDQIVTSSTEVTLDGSQSEDTTGNPINLYRWTNLETNIPRLTIINSDTVNPTFTAPEESGTKTYKIRLRVSIDSGVSFSENSDIVEIEVIPASQTDGPS